MPTKHLYDHKFPEQHKIQDVDIVTLYHEKRYQELDEVVICKDAKGNITATFGESLWDCKPYSRKSQKNENTFNFSHFDSHPKLQRELKIFTYGWLFNKNTKQRKAVKFTTVLTNLKDLRRTYKFLALGQHDSIQSLSKSPVWRDFKTYLSNQDLVKGTLKSAFIVINKVLDLTSWHKIQHGIVEKIEVYKLAEQLSEKEDQQTLAIPDRYCDALFAKAFELVQKAYPHRKLIAQTEQEIQDNFLKGKEILDAKAHAQLLNGQPYKFMNEDGEIIKSRLYSNMIHDQEPKKIADIIAPLVNKLPHISLKDGNDFKRYLNQLITASYVICGGFSGMRYSELEKLTPHSYYKEVFNGRTYHMLQSHTFKLGEKRETWVTASSSELAIELMTVLTEKWRKEAKYPESKYSNTIWVNQSQRISKPYLIKSWNARLRQLCHQLNLIVTEEDYQACLGSNPNSQDKIKEKVKVGKPFPIATHQFRRTLAFYFFKNRLGTPIALKQQLKHLYLTMTDWYGNGGAKAAFKLIMDNEFKKILDNAGNEAITNEMFKHIHTDEALSGTHGKAIIKMRGNLPQMYSSWDNIYQAVKDKKLTLHNTHHSYCTSGYSCGMSGRFNPESCVECSKGSSIINAEHAKWWKRKHTSLTTYMQSEADEIGVSERTAFIIKIRAAEKVLLDHGIEFIPFEKELNIVEVRS
ncbi:hypothetical protein CF386_07985 [Paraphotobacterium marinum]|uniref:Integrase n=1 Tax=Paraphotobacterium marinum TaxID=1755811 RepID=A0A220VF09_9GAMM|nr:hypothetical protein [Paraphotobacterium marinum]ASK78998.1 hypothetical protein CF386_07985 [Paraphotobacterium marinum]